MSLALMGLEPYSGREWRERSGLDPRSQQGFSGARNGARLDGSQEGWSSLVAYLHDLLRSCQRRTTS